MPRSLQDVLRAGMERSRANAPRVIQTQMERAEEMREENRRIRNAKDFPEMAKAAKHAWNRSWEEAKNDVDMKRNARDCFAEREDLWRQVEGMEALRETSNVYKHLYNDLLTRHRGVMDRLEQSLDMEKKKERIFTGSANEARVKGDMEDALRYEERRIMARNEIQNLNYIMYGQEDPQLKPQAREQFDQERLAAWGRNRIMGMRINLERTQAEERMYQLEADEARRMGQVERERTAEANLHAAQAKANALQRFIKDAEDRETDHRAEERPYQNEGEEVGKVGW